MKTLLSIKILFFAFFIPSYAQLAEEVTSSALIKNPAFCAHELVRAKSDTKKINDLELAYYQAMQAPEIKTVNTDYTLPIVVHIIHKNGIESISNDQVLQGIEHINQAFANTGYYDQDIGVSTPFQFCLARQDPNGNATTGINRVISDLAELNLELEDLALKNLIRWDPNQYINIWLVQEICSISSGCGVAGYAYFPDQHGSEIDGIVAEARWMGTTEANSSVLVHELGHYFGLRHTFEGGCSNEDCLMDGDRVCDTRPDQTTAAVPCDDVVNSCSTDANNNDPNNPFTSDEGEHFWNYMDYGDWDCYAEFTQGQSDRMEFFLNEVRFSLLNTTVCADPCPNPILASFEADEVNINVGDAVIFTNLSQNATDYNWFINGIFFSNFEEGAYVFMEAGSFEISLIASNSDPLCLADEYSVTIEVRCPVMGSISASSTAILSGETINFTSSISNANSYTWYVNGNLAGNDQTLDYTFDEVGYFEVYLISENSHCTHRSNSILVQVDTPCQASNANLGLIAYDDLGSLSSIDLVSDSNYIFIGQNTISKKSVDLNDLWIKNFNTEGEFGWNRIKPLVGNDYFLVSGYHQTSDFTRRPVILKIDLNGNILWDIFISQETSNLEPIIEETDDGNFIAVGTSTRASSGFDGFVLKFSPDGEVIWHKGYDDSILSKTHFTNLIPVENGSFIITGTSGFLDFDNQFKYNFFVCKIDSSGNLIWEKVYTTSPFINFSNPRTEVFPKTDGSYIIAMNGTMDGTILILINIDSNGQLLNTVVARNIAYTSSPLKMSSSHDGNILVSGSGLVGRLFKMDQDLNILWSRRYSGFGFINFSDIIELPDHTLLLSGSRYNQDNGNYEGLFLHTDENGFLPSCPVQIITPNEINIDFFAGSIELEPINNPLTFTTISYTTENISTIPTILCPLESGVLDAELNLLTAHTCPGETEYELEICNNGNVNLDPAMPIAFYTANPTEEMATVLDIIPLGQSISPGDCLNITLNSNTAASSGTIYAVFNDDASLNPVFSLINFPVTIYSECNFLNNIDFAENTILESGILDLGPDRTLCPSDTIELNAGAAIAYQWNTGSTDASISVNDPGTYWVNIVDACTEQSDTVEISSYNFNPLDLGADITVCENAVQVLDAGPGYESYLWNNFSTGQMFTAFSAGTYWVAVTDACDDILQDTINISTFPASIIDLGPDTTLCPGDTISFLITGFENYEWSPLDGIDCLDCGNVRIIPTVSNTYTLVASTSMECISVDTIHIEVLNPADCMVSSDANVLENYIFNVFPNPNNGTFEVEVDLPKVKGYELRVYNTLGQILSQKSITTRPVKSRFDMSDAPSGLYLLELASGELKVSKKIIVLR